MTIKIQKLKGIIVEKGTTQEAVADSMGMNRSTFYRKMKDNGQNFTIREINFLVKELSLTENELISIFFSDIVA